MGRLPNITDQDMHTILNWFHDKNGYWPTAKELSLYAGINPNQVLRRWRKMETKGIIKRDKGIRNFQL